MEENKKMIGEIINEFKVKKTATEKKACLRKYVEITDYVDYAMKVAVSRSVIKEVCLNEDTMEFNLNTPERYLAFVITSISLYTNIEFNDEDDYSTYDLMKTNGFLDELFSYLNESTDDYKEFSTVWNMCFEDLKEYYSSIETLFRKAATRIGLISEIGMNKLANAINGLDLEAIKNMINETSQTQDSFGGSIEK